MQTLRAGCSKPEPKILAPPQAPFSWRWSLPLPTNTVWWGYMHTISSHRGNRPTHKHRPPARPLQTNRQDRLQHTAPQLACIVINGEASASFNMPGKQWPTYLYYACLKKRTPTRFRNNLTKIDWSYVIFGKKGSLFIFLQTVDIKYDIGREPPVQFP